MSEAPTSAADDERPRRTAGLARGLAVARRLASNSSLGRLLAAFAAITLVEYGQWITILVFAYKHGGSSAAGLVALAQLLPSVILAPVIGAHLQRFGVARVLAGCYAVSTLALAGSAAAILLHGPPIAVYAGAVLFTLPLGISIPLHNVLVPLVVRHPDELTAANVASGWCKGAGALAGPAVAAVTIAAGGTGAACAVLAGIAVCTPLLASVRAPRASAEPEPDEEGLGHLLAAARTIAARPNTRALVAYRAGAAAIEGAIDLLVVLLAIRILAIGPAAAGYLSSAFGAGGLLGASAAVLLVGRRLALPLAASAVLAGAAVAGLALASSTLAAVVLLLGVGALGSIQSIAAQTLLQRSTPLDVVVCAFVLFESVRDAGLAFGSLAVPALVALGGPRAAFLGIAALSLAAVAATLPRIARMDHEADVPVVAMGVLRNLAIFSSLPAAPLETLAREASYATAAPGEPVIEEGEEGDRYYAITEGRVLVSKAGREIRRMGRGEGFGEIALLHPVKRTATVTPIEPTILLALERPAFLAALGASTRVRDAAGSHAEQLLAEAP